MAKRIFHTTASRRTTRRTLRRGFTLVELLMVIIIISILAGLITATAVPAMRKAKNFTITNEITQLTMALEQYKQEFGDYPPDCAGLQHADTQKNAKQDVLNHLRKAFPRFRVTGANLDERWDNLRVFVKQASTKNSSLSDEDGPGFDIDNLDPASALVFFLGGIPVDENEDGKFEDNEKELLPFSANPTNPFSVGGSRRSLLYDFDPTRLLPQRCAVSGNNKTAIKYVPSYVKSQTGGDPAPFVYFRARNGGYNFLPSATASQPARFQCYLVKPDKTDKPTKAVDISFPYAHCVKDATAGDYHWMNEDTFQIISSGLDGFYFNSGEEDEIGDLAVDGTADPPTVELPSAEDEKTIRFVGPEAVNLIIAEEDNLANFADGVLGDGVD